MSLDDQIAVKKIVKSSGSSFFWGMNILASDQKRAMFSVYAFCRIIDDIADDIKNKQIKKKKLRNWKTRIDYIFSQKQPKTSVENELKIAIIKFKLERSDFYSLIDGMMMDAEMDIKFPSRKKLNLYCDRVAVAVGYLSIKIFGLSKNEKNYAFYLGRAFQLTNIVRDFYEDLKRGRCYISSDYTTKYRIKKNMRTIMNEPKLQNIFQDLLGEANQYYKKASIESKKILKKKIIASEIMKSFYKAIHSKMKNKKINIKKRIRLNLFEKFFVLFLFFVRY